MFERFQGYKVPFLWQSRDERRLLCLQLDQIILVVLGAVLCDGRAMCCNRCSVVFGFEENPLQQGYNLSVRALRISDCLLRSHPFSLIKYPTAK